MDFVKTTSREHFVRVGVLGRVGRFVSVDPVQFSRGTRVICRTGRGLEVGQVVGLGRDDSARGQADGSLLRAVSTTDEFVIRRLERHREDAFAACQHLLRNAGSPAILMDVEQLFDGQKLFFYFLGRPPADSEAWIGPLAEAYESKVRFADFANAVEYGCGPGCGTDEGRGCGDDCAGCAVVDACRAKGA